MHQTKKKTARFINPALNHKKYQNISITKQNTQKVEVNKDGQIEVKESQDVLNVAVSKALESSGLEANESLPVDSLENIEQITQDTSVTTDITASPTDSYPQTECLNEKPSLDNNNTGNDSALGESTTEVSSINLIQQPLRRRHLRKAPKLVKSSVLY